MTNDTTHPETNPEASPAENPADDAPRRYPFAALEAKWQQRWDENKVFQTDEPAPGETSETGDTGEINAAPKYYVLDMFPYPSGSGLHVGHLKNYVPGDVAARLMKMRGRNVLHPMGWDAFGQPAEQAAIKANKNPKNVVPENAAQYKRQLTLLGIAYDWNREINSTDPAYYKWNQWAFLLLRERGLAYRDSAPVNWCVNESTVLANEEVVDGHCWRCDGPVIKKSLPQWKFRTTAYAQKLLDGLAEIDWPDGVKTQQRDWIGRSDGAEVTFPIDGTKGKQSVTVFTTRPDTLWGATFLVLAPEHPLVDSLTTDAQSKAVSAYRAEAGKMSDQDRQSEARPKTGVPTGAFAVNPVSGQRVPVWIADYVLVNYGTGAIMAVPAHDERDFVFARQFDLPIVLVYETEENQREADMTTAAPTGGVMRAFPESVPACPFAGSPNNKETVGEVIAWLETNGTGTRKINYKLRDWLVSRQRYWGTPIPMIHCPKCGEVPVPFADLPVVLPDVENYKPTETGESPLAGIAEFVNVSCPVCGKAARRETDTMAGTVDSSWYFLRFCSPHNFEAAWDKSATDYWMPVDRYIGGREHAVSHLLYARFFTKVFYDAGLISVHEPFASLRNQGMLLAQTPVETATGHPVKPDELGRFMPSDLEMQWLKMSKSKGNAVTPDEMGEKYGTDALRLYILFVAPFEDTIQWSEEAMNGPFRFLNRVWDVVAEQIAPTFDKNFAEKLSGAADEAEVALRRRAHQAVQKVTGDLEEFKFNTAVSELMIFSDALRKFVIAHGTNAPACHESAAFLVKLLSPLAPHIADELWERLGFDGALYLNTWPAFDPNIAKNAEVTLIVQVNGKLRDKITVSADADAAACEALALASPKVANETDGKTVRKVIVIAGKLVNVVV